MRKRFAAVGIGAALLSAGAARPMAACPGCVLANDGFSIPHHHAIRIALATRKAIDGGLIDESARLSAENLNEELARAAAVILYPHTRGKRVMLDVLLVDDNATYRVELRGLSSHVIRLAPGANQPASLRIVTTRHGLNALSNLKLRLPEATSHGLAIVESDAASKSNPPAATPKP